VIGIAQPNNVVGSGGGVTGGGTPWWRSTITPMSISTRRRNFDVHGLVLAGNSIGSRGTIAAVKGTLVCVPTAVRHRWAVPCSSIRHWSSSTNAATRGSTAISARCRWCASKHRISDSGRCRPLDRQRNRVAMTSLQQPGNSLDDFQPAQASWPRLTSGAVDVAVTGAPVAEGYCHCQSCRSYGGADEPFTLWKPEAVKF
jgi:hypothetical protein